MLGLYRLCLSLRDHQKVGEKSGGRDWPAPQLNFVVTNQSSRISRGLFRQVPRLELLETPAARGRKLIAPSLASLESAQEDEQSECIGIAYLSKKKTKLKHRDVFFYIF